MEKKTHLALYGNQKIIRAYCAACDGFALVIDGLLACCDEKFTEEPPHAAKRVTHPESVRKLPPIADRRRVLLEQDYRCFYCLRSFGAMVTRFKDGERHTVTLRHCWDHLVPWVYGQNNYPYNFVAACQVCNSIKAAHIYQSIEEARHAITLQRKAKGWEDL